MKKSIAIHLGIFLSLAASRFIPHPPNFTSLIALSLYVPILFGPRYIFSVLLAFVVTDIFLGLHSTILFTWGSILFIGYFSKYFSLNIISRTKGVLAGVLFFFIITNFGVWLTGAYGYSLNGFIVCYTLALPFLGYTFVSTVFYSALIEAISKIYNIHKTKSI